MVSPKLKLTPFFYFSVSCSQRTRSVYTQFQIVRFVVPNKSEFMVWAEMRRYAFSAKSIHFHHPNRSNGHLTIRPKRLICHKTDLKSIQRVHRNCCTPQSRWVNRFHPFVPPSHDRYMLWASANVETHDGKEKRENLIRGKSDNHTQQVDNEKRSAWGFVQNVNVA